MTPVLTGLLGALGLRVARRHRRAGEVLEGQLEAAEEVESPGHQSPLLIGLRAQHLAGQRSPADDGQHRVRADSRLCPSEKARVSTEYETSTTAAIMNPQPLATRNPATINIQPRLSGIKRFQPRSMSWSYRKRGSDARNQT